MEFYSRTVSFSGNSAVAYLYGELDACSVTCLRAQLAPVAMTGRDIIVDLAALSFVDTTGLFALVDLQLDAATAGGSLRLIDPPRPLCRLLELTGMKDLFAVGWPCSKWLSPQPAGAKVQRGRSSNPHSGETNAASVFCTLGPVRLPRRDPTMTE